MKSRARALRKNSTLSEVLLWNALKRKQMRGLDFDRQKVINNIYILDFYCPALRLAIEIDGCSHDHKYAYDAERDKYLAKIGIRVIRFDDLDVKTRIGGVLADIEKIATTTPSCRKAARHPFASEGENAYRLTRSQTAASNAALGAGVGVAAGALSSGAIGRALDVAKTAGAAKEANANPMGEGKDGWPDAKWYKAWNKAVVENKLYDEDPVEQYLVKSAEEACKVRNDCESKGASGLMETEGPCGALFAPRGNIFDAYLSVMCLGYNTYGNNTDLVKLSKTKENEKKSCDMSCGIWENNSCTCGGPYKLEQSGYGGPYCNIIVGSSFESIKAWKAEHCKDLQ